MSSVMARSYVAKDMSILQATKSMLQINYRLLSRALKVHNALSKQ